MSHTITFIKTILLAVLLFGGLLAQEKTRFSLETDPATFAFNGYALHARVAPAGWSRIRLGAGVYSMKFPALFVNINPDNADKGWEVQLKTGIGFFSEYFFNAERSAWLVGGQLAWQNYLLKNGASPGTRADYSIVLLMPYVGYRWFPLKNGFYVQPWAGLGYAKKVGGSTRIDSRTYQVSPLLPFITVHLGYRF